VRLEEITITAPMTSVNSALVFRAGNTFAKSLDFAKNQISVGGPGEGLGVLVTLGQVVEHSFLQHTNGGVTAAANTALGHFREESFHQLEPASAGGREVNLIARVPCQPSANLGNFVSTVVVHDQMHIEPAGRLRSISLRNRKNS
jgi:hypothetical protein